MNYTTMIEKLKKIINWLSFHFGGMRGDCLFEEAVISEMFK